MAYACGDRKLRGVYSYHTVPYRGLERPSQRFELYIVALSTYLGIEIVCGHLDFPQKHIKKIIQSATCPRKHNIPINQNPDSELI